LERVRDRDLLFSLPSPSPAPGPGGRVKPGALARRHRSHAQRPQVVSMARRHGLAMTAGSGPPLSSFDREIWMCRQRRAQQGAAVTLGCRSVSSLRPYGFTRCPPASGKGRRAALGTLDVKTPLRLYVLPPSLGEGEACSARYSLRKDVLTALRVTILPRKGRGTQRSALSA